jgi:hypothetical protein
MEFEAESYRFEMEVCLEDCSWHFATNTPIDEWRCMTDVAMVHMNVEGDAQVGSFWHLANKRILILYWTGRSNISEKEDNRQGISHIKVQGTREE